MTYSRSASARRTSLDAVVAHATLQHAMLSALMQRCACCAHAEARPASADVVGAIDTGSRCSRGAVIYWRSRIKR